MGSKSSKPSRRAAQKARHHKAKKAQISYPKPINQQWMQPTTYNKRTPQAARYNPSPPKSQPQPPKIKRKPVPPPPQAPIAKPSTRPQLHPPPPKPLTKKTSTMHLPIPPSARYQMPAQKTVRVQQPRIVPQKYVPAQRAQVMQAAPRYNKSWMDREGAIWLQEERTGQWKRAKDALGRNGGRYVGPRVVDTSGGGGGGGGGRDYEFEEIMRRERGR